MKLKWRNLPAIVTFLAGFVTCIITIVCRYPLNKMLWVLIAVMLIFYTIGLIIRMVMMRVFEEKEEEEPQETEEEETDGEVTRTNDEQLPETGEQSEV